jgi:hypothetical protein
MVIALAGGALRHYTAIAFALAPNLRQHVGGHDRRIRDRGRPRLFPVRAGSSHR